MSCLCFAVFALVSVLLYADIHFRGDVMAFVCFPFYCFSHLKTKSFLGENSYQCGSEISLRIHIWLEDVIA